MPITITQQHLNQLIEFLSIKSISTDPAYKDEIKRAQKWLITKLESLGFKTRLLLPQNPTLGSSANAVVYAEYIVDPKLPTVMIYGHYDVQPEGNMSEWNSTPFEPTIKDGKIYARGATDNKGQLFANILAVEHYIKNVSPKRYNIKFFIEGEEETAGTTTEEVVRSPEFKKLLKADYLWVADGPWIAHDKPTVVYALRGIAYFDLTIKNADKELHSGIYGNLVLNPGNLAGYIISKLKDIHTNKLLIPGIYEKVRTPSQKEIDLVTKASPSWQTLKKETTARVLTPQFDGKKMPSVYLAGLLPSLDIHGIWGGFMTPKASKTIIPSTMHIKFSIRLVPNLTVDYVKSRVEEYLKKIIPQGVKWQLDLLGGGDPFITDPDTQELQKVLDIMTDVFGKPAVLLAEGGSIPIVTTFAKEFSPIVLMPNYGLPDDNLHAANEKIDIKQIEGGAEVLLRWLTT